jgi:superfamily II DNA or RNA helicase
MEPLYEHQKKIIQEDPKKCGLFLGTGGGKTRTALELARGKTLIIVPKQQKLDETWQKNARKFGIDLKMKVVSKEDFRRDYKKYERFDTVIADESHFLCGMSPDTRRLKGKDVPKTSQLYEALSWYLKEHDPDRFYLCSATPASKPMNVFAIGTLLGRKLNFTMFRDRFYMQRRMGFRINWIPKTDKASQDLLASYIKKMGYTGKISDWVDTPQQLYKTIYVGLTPEQKRAIKELKETEADPMVFRARQRTIENGIYYGFTTVKISETEDKLERETTYYDNEKIDQVIQLAQEFPKMLVFCAYTGQIIQMQLALQKKGFKVRTLTGKTKDRATVIQEAESMPQCIVIAQASISAGYELPTFPCVVFASVSYKALDRVQAMGRVLRINALKKNIYIDIIVKSGIDEMAFNAVKNGVDFNEKILSN